MATPTSRVMRERSRSRDPSPGHRINRTAVMNMLESERPGSGDKMIHEALRRLGSGGTHDPPEGPAGTHHAPSGGTPEGSGGTPEVGKLKSISVSVGSQIRGGFQQTFFGKKSFKSEKK